MSNEEVSLSNEEVSKIVVLARRVLQNPDTLVSQMAMTEIVTAALKLSTLVVRHYGDDPVPPVAQDDEGSFPSSH